MTPADHISYLESEIQKKEDEIIIKEGKIRVLEDNTKYQVDLINEGIKTDKSLLKVLQRGLKDMKARQPVGTIEIPEADLKFLNHP